VWGLGFRDKVRVQGQGAQGPRTARALRANLARAFALLGSGCDGLGSPGMLTIARWMGQSGEYHSAVCITHKQVFSCVVAHVPVCSGGGRATYDRPSIDFGHILR